MAVASVTAAQTAAIDKSRTSLATNYQTFLSLLTTQLKNQDPTAPMDTNAFTQQLTQMTGVEQQLLSNDLLTKLVDQGAGSVGNAVGLIGKTVTSSQTSTNITNGKASWLYDIGAGATSGTIEVKNSAGTVVHRANLSELDAGRHTYVWDGKTLSGKALGDGGPYTATMVASDISAKPVTATPMVQGLATAVEQIDGETVLTLATGKVP